MTAITNGAAPNSVTTNLTQNAFTNINALLSGSFTNSFSAVTTYSSTQNYTLSGLAVGDFVLISKGTAQVGLGTVAAAHVATANTLPVTFLNSSGATITPTASDTYYYTVVRPLYSLSSLPLNSEGGGTD